MKLHYMFYFVFENNVYENYDIHPDNIQLHVFSDIKKTRMTDEAKYSVSIESDGAIADQATFSVFIKGKIISTLINC